MEDKKLIIPAEVKVCATCSYWDGERRVDQEVGVVVVTERCHGECLIKGDDRQGLLDTRVERECMWEGLWPDDAQPASDSGASIDNVPGASVPDGRIRLSGTDPVDDPGICPLPGSARV
jgi:hypothetical protein